ncbi:PfkB family carbohydrate kinase [Patescibacteria group bacterium]
MSEEKIKSLEELRPIIDDLKKRGKKIVLSHGAFDSIQHGHRHYLRESKKLGDILVVSVVADKFVRKGLTNPIFNQDVRMETIVSFEFVDFVVLCEELGAWDIIQGIEPDIYAKGTDSKRQLDNPASGLSKERNAVERHGGEICFTQSFPIHSVNILNRYSNNIPEDILVFLGEFGEKYNMADITEFLDRLCGLKVLVIGETVVDEYRFMSPLGKPSKATVLCAQYKNKEIFAGGAIVLANHIASICSNVDLISSLGRKDSQESFIRSSLKYNVTPYFLFQDDIPTTVKRRFIDQTSGSKLFEEYIYEKKALLVSDEKKLAQHLKKSLPKYDLVIVLDYGQGFFSENVIDVLSKESKFLAVNAQTNSGNTGFNYVTKYPETDFVCIDEMEARLAVQDDEMGLKKVIGSICEKTGADKIIVTLGGAGCLSYERNGKFVKTPSFAFSVLDPVGAGDTFLAFSSPCVASNFPMEVVSFIGSVASAVAVGILGNKSSVSKEEFLKVAGSLLE